MRLALFAKEAGKFQLVLCAQTLTPAQGCHIPLCQPRVINQSSNQSAVLARQSATRPVQHKNCLVKQHYTFVTMDGCSQLVEAQLLVESPQATAQYAI